MNIKRFFRSAAACVLAAALLSPAALAASGGSAESPGAVSAGPAVSLTDSSAVVSAALHEVGYTEGVNEYSKYGDWYGLPNAFWCDMFVSWCAMKGGVPAAQFPRQCSCTSHVELFTQMGRYQASAARGGTYIPQQGDVIFFYNNVKYPTAKVCNHTGLVLYAEDGYVYTIEGNALANRLDYTYAEVSDAIEGELDPPDRVVVNRYPLNAPHIHGYGIPAYESRTSLELDGFVDLGRHAGNAGMFQYLCDMDLMPATSSHTFSPDHGMTRGEFLMLAANFFDLPDNSAAALPFDDVSPDSPYYSAIMSARAAGLISGTDKNLFRPDLYISPTDAGMIFSRALDRLGLEPAELTFSDGDYSYMLTPYTIRADIAGAFYTLCWQAPLTEDFDGQIFLGESECPVRTLNGVCYVPVEALQEVFPELELVEEPEQAPELTDESEDVSIEQEPAEEESAPGQEPEADAKDTALEDGLTEEDTSPEQEPEDEEPEELQQPDIEWVTERVSPSFVTLQYGENVLAINGFVYQGLPYVNLAVAAGLLPAELEYSEESISEEFPEQTGTVIRLLSKNTRS